MDQNSLPMVPDLDVFPRPLRVAFVVAVALFVAFLVLAVLIGVLSA